ncbi:hypothetical protein [Phenylobacterium aquaticum]|uniref:hypothetical protein n=1 Tax=Phenylobacterium aquaticum TaxID=1763816 RepID=UPI001F5CBE0A|nr:hypothetical protein [Phenylobacterium aquaticum]MCI3133251.1 hypothetical protein [Phenylobacterium aquaticum]
MILKKAIQIACAVAALSAASAVGVVAAAFAVYAALRPMIGPAWAAAAVCALAAAMIGLGGLIAALAANPPRFKKPVAEEKDLVSRLIELARDKPLVAASAVLAAGAVAFKNPKVTAAIVSAFMAGRNATPKK